MTISVTLLSIANLKVSNTVNESNPLEFSLSSVFLAEFINGTNFFPSLCSVIEVMKLLTNEICVELRDAMEALEIREAALECLPIGTCCCCTSVSEVVMIFGIAEGSESCCSVQVLGSILGSVLGDFQFLHSLLILVDLDQLWSHSMRELLHSSAQHRHWHAQERSLYSQTY
jgi:hypothetical protein